jgi:hypothetical protein
VRGSKLVAAEIEMSTSERRDRECGKHHQQDENGVDARALENKSNLVRGHISGNPAANDNSKAWPLIPFPDDWYSS